MKAFSGGNRGVPFTQSYTHATIKISVCLRFTRTNRALRIVGALELSLLAGMSAGIGLERGRSVDIKPDGLKRTNSMERKR